MPNYDHTINKGIVLNNSDSMFLLCAMNKLLPTSTEFFNFIVIKLLTRSAVTNMMQQFRAADVT